MNDASILGLIVTIGFYVAYMVGMRIGRKDGVTGALEQLEEQKIIHIDKKGEISPEARKNSFLKNRSVAKCTVV